jgi:Uma2 family endonuclease
LRLRNVFHRATVLIKVITSRSIALVWLYEALDDVFEEQLVYVGMNLIFYYEEGAPSRRRDPDVLVAKGVHKHKRRSFRPWEEKKLPCTLFEILSKKTWRVDVHMKPAEYAAAGVKEYFLFDPEGMFINPPLQGYRTVKGKPVAIKPEVDGSLISKQLGLRLVPEHGMLRLYDLKTGQPVLTRNERNRESNERAEQANERAEQANQRAEAERQRADQANQRAEAERRRADEARQRAEEERQRVAALQAEIARLAALLKDQRGPSE